LKRLYGDLKDKGLEVVGVTTYYGYIGNERDLTRDAEYTKMGDFVKQHELPWPTVFGERDNFINYGVSGIPHITVIDRKGNVHSYKIGYSAESFAKFRAEIEKLLEEK
jgi:hypothetical protein